MFHSDLLNFKVMKRSAISSSSDDDPEEALPLTLFTLSLSLSLSSHSAHPFNLLEHKDFLGHPSGQQKSFLINKVSSVAFGR